MYEYLRWSLHQIRLEEFILPGRAATSSQQHLPSRLCRARRPQAAHSREEEKAPGGRCWVQDAELPPVPEADESRRAGLPHLPHHTAARAVQPFWVVRPPRAGWGSLGTPSQMSVFKFKKQNKTTQHHRITKKTHCVETESHTTKNVLKYFEIWAYIKSRAYFLMGLVTTVVSIY